MGEPTARSLALASWNVHAWVGADRRPDVGRAAAVIAALDCDVVLLQEVEEVLAPGERDALAEVSARTGHEVVRGPAREGGRGPYGNALLTRLPVRSIRRVDLSVPGREPRGALDVELETGGGALRVITTHLGLAQHERRAQVTRLLALLEKSATPKLVLAGDLNEWEPWGSAIGALERALGRSPALRTFPSRRPVFALDRIWVRPASCLTALSVWTSPEASAASDHLPLRAELQLASAGGGSSSGRASPSSACAPRRPCRSSTPGRPRRLLQ